MQEKMKKEVCLVPARIDNECQYEDDIEVEILEADDSVRIVAALNPFSTEKVESKAPCGLTIQQIVGSKCPENVEVWVNGEHIERELWAEFIPEPKSLVNIKVLPGKGVLRAILTLVIVVGSILLANALAPEVAALLDISSKIGLQVIEGTLAAIFSTAGFLALNAIIPPSLPDQESFERIGSLTGARNRIGAFAPIPRLYGKMKYFPPVPMTGTPYTEIVGNYTYLRALFVLGYGPLEIAGLRVGGGNKLTLKDNPQIASEILIGETQIDNFEDVELEIGEHNDITLYTNSVFQENVSVVLNSTAQQPNQTVTDNISEIRTTQLDTEEIIVDIEFPSGLFSLDKKGKNSVSTVTFKFEYRPAGTNDPWTDAFTQQNANAPGSHNFWYDSWLGNVSNEIQTEVPSSNTYPHMVIRSSERKTLRRSFRWKVPKGQYEVRVTRVETYNSGKSIGSTDAVWTNLKSVKYVKPFVLDNVVLMALRIKATDELSGALDNVSVKATSRLLAWDGTSWVETTTRNPAWAYVDILSGNATRNPINKDTELDKDAILDWANWCDTNGFYYDRVIDGTATVFQAIREVTAAGRASWSYQDNLFSVIREETSQIPLQVFTPRNTSGLKYEKLFPDIPHAFRVKFVDPNTYQDTERFVYDDGYDSTTATKFQELPLVGVTDPDQAWKLARFHLAQLKLRPERYSFQVPVENIIVQRGDAASLQHDVLLVGLAAGRIKSVTRGANNNITSFESDQELNMESGKTYGIKIRYVDASGAISIAQSQIQAVTPTTFTVTPISPLPSDIKEGDLFVHGEFGKETIDIKILKITPKSDLTAEITAVPLSPEILNADQGTIPAFNPVITKSIDPTTRVPPIPTITNIQSDSKVLFRDIGGNLRARILVTYDIPNEEGYSDIEIEARYSDSQTPQNWRYVKSKAEVKEISIIDGIEEGKTYDIQLRSLRGNLSSRWTTVTQHTVIGKTDNPSDVANFAARVAGFDIILSWDHIDDLDRKEYEIREGSDWTTGTVIGITSDNTFKVTSDSQQQRTFWIKAIDTSGNYSVNAVSAVADASSVTLPDDVVQFPVPNVVKGDNEFLKGISPLTQTTSAGDVDLVSSKFPLGRLGVTAGSKAGLTIECYHTGGGTMTGLLKFYDSSGVYISEGDDIRIIDSHSNTTDYGVVRTWIKIPANATQVEVGARRSGGNSGTFYVKRPMLHLGWVRPPIMPPNIQDALDVPYVDGQTLEDLKPAEPGAEQTSGKPIDILTDGTTYGRTKLTALTSGEVDFSKSGVLNRTLDNVSDTSLFAKVSASDLTNNRLDFSKDWLNKTIDYLNDGLTYGRVKNTALTLGEVDISLGGVINKNVDYLSESGTRFFAIEPGADSTGNRITGIAQQLLPNWDFSIADSSGKPAGIRGVESITDQSQIQFGGIGIQILSSPDTTVAYGFPAIPIDDQQKYRVTIRHKSSASSSSGLYLRMNELDSELPSGKTHIGTSTGESIVAVRTSLVDLVSNGPMPGTTVRDDVYTYTPTPGTKFASFSMYSLYSGVTYEVEWVQISVIPKTQDEIPDGSTYGRVDNSALSTNLIDVSKSGVINKSVDYLSESSTRFFAAEPGATSTQTEPNLYDVSTDGMVSQRTLSDSFPGCIFGNSDGSRAYTGDATQLDFDALGIAVGETITLSGDVSVSGDTSDVTLHTQARVADASNNTVGYFNGNTITLPNDKAIVTYTRQSGDKYIDLRVSRSSGTSLPTVAISNGMANRGSVARPYVRPVIGSTRGAKAGVDLKDSSGNVLTDADIHNQMLVLDQTGSLVIDGPSGQINLGNVTLSGLGGKSLAFKDKIDAIDDLSPDVVVGDALRRTTQVEIGSVDPIYISGNDTVWSGYRLWVGADKPQDAPFCVDQNGKAKLIAPEIYDAAGNLVFDGTKFTGLAQTQAAEPAPVGINPYVVSCSDDNDIKQVELTVQSSVTAEASISLKNRTSTPSGSYPSSVTLTIERRQVGTSTWTTVGTTSFSKVTTTPGAGQYQVQSVDLTDPEPRLDGSTITISYDTVIAENGLVVSVTETVPAGLWEYRVTCSQPVGRQLTLTDNTGGGFVVSSSSAQQGTGGTYLPTTGGTISGNLAVSGDLTVSGNLVTVSSQQVDIGDNILRLNAGLSSTSSPTLDAGIEVERGAEVNVQIYWDETNDRWVVSTPAGAYKIWHDGNAPATAVRWPTWSEVTDKPSTFTPSAHEHSRLDYVGIIGSLEAEGTRNLNYSGLVHGEVASSTTNRPAGLSFGSFLQWGGNTTSHGNAQLLIGWTSGDEDFIAFRSLRDTTDGWWPWKRIFHEGFMGTGSGLDADKLDGVEGSSYARLDLSTNQTFTSSITTTALVVGSSARCGRPYSSIELYNGSGSALLSTQDGNGRIQLKWNATYGTGESYVVDNEPAGMWLFDPINPTDRLFKVQYAPAGSGAISWQDILSVGTSTFTYLGNTIWHAGNDGSGSGLDADKLDGLDSSAFLQTTGGTITGLLTTTSNIRLQSGNWKYQIGLSGGRLYWAPSDSAGNFLWSKEFGYDPNTSNWYAETGFDVSGKVSASSADLSNELYFSGSYANRWFTRVDVGGVSSGWQTDASSNILFDMTDGAGNKTVRLRSSGDSYLTGGNVGIGTSSPVRKLDVNGDTIIWGKLEVGEIRGGSPTSGQQLVLNAGESYLYATGQTNEYVYINAESGLQVNSSPDNWTSGWAGRKTATLRGDYLSVQGGADFTGDVKAPRFKINDDNTKLEEGSNNSVRVRTNSGYVDVGPQNTSWCHFNTDRPYFYFNKGIRPSGSCYIYNSNTGFDSNNFQLKAGNGYGLRFWASDNYKIYMSSASDSTWGGRAPGETTSDYNMYFKMTSGTNRGWVFKSGSTPVAGIDAGGNIYASGTVTAAEVTATSDEKLKANITDFTDCCEIVAQLRPVSFQWKGASGNPQGPERVGFIAQEVQTVLPHVVHERGDGILTIDYGAITTVLAGALKEQEKKIKKQEKQIKKQEKRIAELEGMLIKLAERIEKVESKNG